MRHAKSDWTIDGLSDFQRPLNKRGTKDASKMGAWMAQAIELPQLIICSTARRAQQTQQLVLLATQQQGSETQGIKQQALDELYLASHSQINHLISEKFSVYNRIMVIAHNPGLDSMLSLLCPHAEPTEDGKLMTTANIALIEFDDILNPKLISFQRPKDI